MSIKRKVAIGGSAVLLTGGLAVGLVAVTGEHGAARQPGAAAPGAKLNGQNVVFSSSSAAPAAAPSTPTTPQVMTFDVTNHTGTDGQVCARDASTGNSLGCSNNVPVDGTTQFTVTAQPDVSRVALTAKMNDGKVNDNLSVPASDSHGCLTIQDQKFPRTGDESGPTDVDFTLGC